MEFRISADTPLEYWRLGPCLRLRPLDLRDGKRKRERTWTRTEDASFGAWLKRQREQIGISLPDVSKRTRIPVRLLRAIESNDFESLPGGLYTRNHLRQYAQAVGLRSTDVIEAFDVYANEPLEAAAMAAVPFVAITTVRVERSKRLRARTWGLAFAGGVFRLLEAVLPKRVTREEFGDATEYFNAPDRRTWEIWLKTISTIVWALVNSARYVMAMFWGRPGAD